MKKIIKKVLSVVLVVVIMLTAAPLSGFVGLEFPKWLDFSINASAATSGTCGKNLTWFFNEYSGTLTISGVGEMDDFKPGYAPWDNWCDGNIYKVIIGANVTSIGWYAFYCCVNLLDVYYLGEEQQWNKILIGDYNYYLHHADIHCYSNDVSSLVADCSVGDIVEFGSYPQSFVKDSELYTTLNSLPLNWTSLEYYIGTGNPDGQMQPSDYMKYADVVHNGIKYRAIISTQYRPEDTSYISSTDTSLQDEHGYLLNKVYWFKYEPLQWRVLDPNDGFVMCEKMIDVQAFNNTIYYNEIDDRLYQDLNCEKYANDYTTSSIRDWLNNQFYNTTFTEGEKNEIRTADLTHFNYDSTFSYVNTTTIYDKIFLLSYDETKNESYGFSSNSYEPDVSRQAYGTDYARCQGLPLHYSAFGEAWWFLRSSVDTGAAHVVNLFGYSDDYATGVTFCCGIRPALKFNTKSDNPNFDNTDCYTNGHKDSMAVVENLITSTCITDGSYDTVVYCPVCDAELSRVTTTVTATGHFYDNGVCTRCGESESNSDKKYYIAGRIFNYNLDYYVKECNSSTYNPTLANMMAALSVAVYSKENIVKAQESLGFTCFDVFEYDSSYNPHTCGYSLAFKESDFSDDMICLVSVRGSQSLDYNADWIGNFEILTDSDGKHIGFSYPANNIYQKIQSYISKENITKNVKFFITGHSRGAAVANLLAVKLMENGISSENVYNYNFACPDVACKQDFPNYTNIFNLCNRKDIVPLLPGPICSTLTIDDNVAWGKYGKTYWFTKEPQDTNDFFAGHSSSLYLEFFNQKLSPSDWSYDYLDKVWNVTFWLVGWVAKILCPVDVIITDKFGNKIASVINGEINYYDSNFGDVIIITEGDKKVIYINGEKDFNIELIGTDTGTMTYSIEKCNLASGEIYESKIFNDVTLEDGKTMYSPVSEAETTNGIQLFVTDEKDGEMVYTNIINEDGTEEIYYNYSFNIQTPSRTEIRHKDGIKLHANIEGTAPGGSYVVWTASNGKFKTEEINNGNSLKIVSDSNGKTTFTATLHSADGEVLATDTIEMKSKAGFFDKIGSFFRSLFGGTKIYEN